MKLSEAYAIVKKKLDAAEVPYRYFRVEAACLQYRFHRSEQLDDLDCEVCCSVYFDDEMILSESDTYYVYSQAYRQKFPHFAALFDYLDKIAPKQQIDKKSAKEIEV